MEVGESGRDLSESRLENRGVSVKVEWFGHISVLEVFSLTLNLLKHSTYPSLLKDCRKSKPYSIPAKSICHLRLDHKALSSIFIGSPTDGRSPKLISSVTQIAERASTMMSFLSSMRGGLKR